MNKTLLLIICDFLLLNLLALTRWEKAEPTRPARTPVPAAVAGAATKEQDLVETMRLSLQDERATRDSLGAELAAREKSLAALAEEKQHLATSLDSSQRTAQTLAGKLAASVQDAALTREQMAKLQRELDLRQAEVERQQNQLSSLEKAQLEAREKIEGLSVAVKVAEQEKSLLRQTTTTLQQQVEAERRERQRVQETTVQLAQGVGQLAEKSGELTRELRDHRPLTANTIFQDIRQNRVDVVIQARRTNSFFGPVERTTTAHAVLTTDGAKVYAIFHGDETPFGFNEIIHDWAEISATIVRDSRRLPVSALCFLSLDPRVIALPLDATQAAALGVKIYPVALDPLKFPEALLVNRDGAGYGEIPFKLEANQPVYVRMDDRLFRRVFGDFSPSRGDLVFSQSGELLGLMVSSGYCAVINNFLPTRTFQLGDTSKQKTSEILTELSARLKGLPFRLQ